MSLPVPVSKKIDWKWMQRWLLAEIWKILLSTTTEQSYKMSRNLSKIRRTLESGFRVYLNSQGINVAHGKGRFFQKVLAKFSNLSKCHSCQWTKIVSELSIPVNDNNKILVILWIALVIKSPDYKIWLKNANYIWLV